MYCCGMSTEHVGGLGRGKSAHVEQASKLMTKYLLLAVQGGIVLCLLGDCVVMKVLLRLRVLT